MSPHAIQFHEALEAISVIVGYHGGWMPVYRTRESHTRAFYRPAGAPGLGSVIRALDERYSDQIELGLPEKKPFHGGVSTVTILWAKVSGPDQLRRAQAFRPRPTLVLADGQSSRLCVWWLDKPVAYFQAIDANRRIAYALRAVQKWGDPDVLRIPCPGTCVREGRTKPVPVRVTRLNTASFDVKQIVGRLKEPPAKDRWRAA